MDAILISGKREGTRFTNARAVRYPSTATALEFAKSQGWKKVGKAHSGIFYELRSDGWWKTSATDYCDEEHGLPPNGVKLCVNFRYD